MESGFWKDGKFVGETPPESKTVTLYISEDSWYNYKESNPTSWKTRRNLESDNVYTGEVSNGVPNGQGTFTFSDDHKYVGAWKDGRMHGRGTFTWAKGDKFVGEYKYSSCSCRRPLKAAAKGVTSWEPPVRKG